jgi:hypothetical protein
VASAGGFGGDATASNSGTNAANGPNGIGIEAVTNGGGTATANNSGSNAANGSGGIGIAAQTTVGGNATAINSGSNAANGPNGIGIAALTQNGGNATAINSGSNAANGPGGIGIFASTLNGGDAAVINSGTTTGGVSISATGGNAILTDIVGARIVGAIEMTGTSQMVNFAGGNWLLTINTSGGGPTIVNAGGAPFVSSSTTVGKSTITQVAVLDPTVFALADRSVANFTGDLSQLLQDRFAAMSSGAGGGALGFAPNDSSVAASAQAAFAGIPSVAMSYASSNPRPILGKAPPAAPYYDTTVWASGFGGVRQQHADGAVLSAHDTAFGGALGIDRRVSGELRLGAFVGARGSREQVELDVQRVDSTYVFGGVYGRFDWVTQYFDFALYGGGIDNKSTRGIANNLAPNGFEFATASFGGWFVSPEATYGYRIAVNKDLTVTPRVRLRYVGGALDGFSESGSMQNLSVGRRALNDLEERGEVEVTTLNGPLKAAASIGVIGLERLGNPTVNAVLLAQNLSFATPGKASAVGGVLGTRVEYRTTANVSLFVAGEGIVMSDRSDSFAATGGAKVSFLIAIRTRTFHPRRACARLQRIIAGAAKQSSSVEAAGLLRRYPPMRSALLRTHTPGSSPCEQSRGLLAMTSCYFPATLRSAALMRSCQPGPSCWKKSSTSRSSRNVTVSFPPGKGTVAVLAGPSTGLVVTALKAFSAAARASGSRRGFGASRQSLDRSRESSLPIA